MPASPEKYEIVLTPESIEAAWLAFQDWRDSSEYSPESFVRRIVLALTKSGNAKR